jgi:hypothetical protein
MHKPNPTFQHMARGHRSVAKTLRYNTPLNQTTTLFLYPARIDELDKLESRNIVAYSQSKASSHSCPMSRSQYDPRSHHVMLPPPALSIQRYNTMISFHHALAARTARCWCSFLHILRPASNSVILRTVAMYSSLPSSRRRRMGENVAILAPRGLQGREMGRRMALEFILKLKQPVPRHHPSRQDTSTHQIPPTRVPSLPVRSGVESWSELLIFRQVGRRR